MASRAYTNKGEGEGEIDCGGEGDYGKVCFLSNLKKTFNVNLAPKQTTLLCSALPSPLTIYTIPEIFKETSFYEGQRWENIVVVKGRGGESEEERM